MSYTLTHSYVNTSGGMSIQRADDRATVRFSKSGRFRVRFPGKLTVIKSATYTKHIFVIPPDVPEGAARGDWRSQDVSLPLTVEIRDPDGKLFEGDQVTRNDLKKFRDLRGVTQGSWTYTVYGESTPIPIIEGLTRVSPGRSRLTISLLETVKSISASPLVNESLPIGSTQRYTFDLFRVGTFTATSNDGVPFINLKRSMRLLNPAGEVVATSNNNRLTYPVTLRTLNQSRGANDEVRRWTLEVLPVSGQGPLANATAIWASVIGTTTIRTSTLQDRINVLIGAEGENVSIYGEQTASTLLARLKILDEVSAESIDMHGLLDSVIKREKQDAGVDTDDIKKDVAYTVASRDRDYGYALKASENGLKVNKLNVRVGASTHIQPAIPALSIEVHVAGNLTMEIGGVSVAKAKVRDSRIRLEVGLRLTDDGTFAVESWIEPNRVDIDLDWGAVPLGPFFLLGALIGGEYLESKINKSIQSGFAALMNQMLAKVPHILAMILGAHFTYRSLRLDGNDIVFDYVAPLEPDPKPSDGYQGVIGRKALALAPDTWQLTPRSLGNTWQADNLAKIDHIVVVMMENRSFDHMLGYRAQLAGQQGSDGLSDELITFLSEQGYPVRKLKNSGIVPNTLGYKTQFLAHVGHTYKDVAEQLSKQLTSPLNRLINSPEGFITNFEPKLEHHPELQKEDVLGYYDGDDLKFCKFLADNYAYCDTYFCAHPGPTLPNRMYSLTGDVQYDRVGEAIMENNDGDNFALSRATTIFDLLTRKRVSWRVYESFPSVTMLRMFARYATDNTNIVPVSQFKTDVMNNNLPSVTVVDPAMHHFPQNDDHIPADMYRGQLFLKEVYDTLRLSPNPDLWRKTMLIVTYDEHGGFYDHVVPPIADIRTRPRPLVMVGDEPGRIAERGEETSREAIVDNSVTTKYGPRVPTFVVSPWSVVGKGPDVVLDHCSILKTILARFCGTDKPFLSDRVHASQSFNAFLSATTPRLDVSSSPPLPPLPTPVRLANGRAIITEPVSRKQMQQGNVDYHDLTGMLGRLLGR